MPRIANYWETTEPKVLFELPKFRVAHYEEAGVVCFQHPSSASPDSNNPEWVRGTVLYIDNIPPDRLDDLVDTFDAMADVEIDQRRRLTDSLTRRKPKTKAKV